MSKKMIAKNTLLGFFVFMFGFFIVAGMIQGWNFSYSFSDMSAEIMGDMKGIIFASFILLYFVSYFILDVMTRKEKNKWNDVLHFVLSLELLFYGGVGLLQGGEWWFWIYVALGVSGFLTGFNFLWAKSWK